MTFTDACKYLGAVLGAALIAGILGYSLIGMAVQAQPTYPQAVKLICPDKQTFILWRLDSGMERLAFNKFFEKVNKQTLEVSKSAKDQFIKDMMDINKEYEGVAYRYVGECWNSHVI